MNLGQSPNSIFLELISKPETSKLLFGNNSGFQSSSLRDLILWNILISFIVNISSSAAYDFFREKVKNGEEVTQSNIEDNIEIFNENLYIDNHINKKELAHKCSKYISRYNIENSDYFIEKLIEEFVPENE